MFSKTKTKTGKAINLKIYLLVHGQKLIFNLGIPLRGVLPEEVTDLKVTLRVLVLRYQVSVGTGLKVPGSCGYWPDGTRSLWLLA